MSERLAFLLHRLNIGNICLAYFFLVPVFLPRMNETGFIAVFSAGYLVSGLVVVLALSERLSVMAERVTFKRVTLLFVIMAAFCLFSVLVNTPQSLAGPAGYFNKYLKVIFPVISMLVMINIWTLKDIPTLYRLITATAAVSLVLALIEIPLNPGSFPGFPRIGVILFDDPNKYALFLNIFYGLVFPKLLNALRTRQPAFGLVLVNGAVLVALLLTQSRSGMLTCVVITAFCVFATRARRFILTSLLALLPVLLLFLLALAYRYSQPDGAMASDVGRLWTYMVGLNIVQDRPLLGIGFGNIVNVYDEYGGIYYLLLGKPLGIHNTMLEVLAEQGVFGLLAYMLMVFVPIGMLVRRIVTASRTRYPVLELAALSIPVGFFCYGSFYVNYLADDYFWIYMTIPLIVLRSPAYGDAGAPSPAPDAFGGPDPLSRASAR